ncbi:hypothetical protein C0991_007680 [Blastosporella zonata]|nr:hypothetical protein C0991_007680 [Blastosporella zonata]
MRPATQYCDGLRGAFIVYDPDDPYKSRYDVDDESTIITLADWYHASARSLLPKGQIPPASQTTLINGKGRHPDYPSTTLSVINVQNMKRYRLRIIAMACDPAFTFSIDSHTLTIIEADGEYTQPLVVDSLVLYAGQRYSAILTANQPVGNYWIRSNPDRGFPGFEGGRNSAILRYADAPEEEPTSTSAPVNPLKEVNLHGLVNPQAPGLPIEGGADYSLYLHTTFNRTSFQFTMNDVTYIPPTVPVLLQILSGVRTAQDLLPKGAVYSLPPNKVIEISLSGTGGDMGGPHSFYVVRSGDSNTYNYINPVQRDTVSTGLEDGNATIRFVTDNAGPWFLHWCVNLPPRKTPLTWCTLSHIDWHLEL